jgi:putative oxidoreductase
MTISDVGLLILRLGIGLTFAAHGAQKAFGWWGGPGPGRWRGAIEKMGFAPVELFAGISIAAELGGGLLMALGFLTPIAAAVLIAQSIVIVFHVHWPKGFFASGGGYEHPFALGIASLAICLLAAGAISLDAALNLAWSTEIRILAALVGIAAGVVSVAVPRLAAQRQRSAAGRASSNDLRRT